MTAKSATDLIDEMRASGSGAASGIASPAVTPAPSSRLPGERLGLPLSERELAVLAAYARTGDVRAAAAALGVPYTTARNRLGWLYAKLGTYGAINAFRALGWLRVPEDVAA